MGSEDQDLLFHSEVGGLSHGKVLKKLYELWKEVYLEQDWIIQKETQTLA
jgi:hypothetical protein